MKGRPLGSSGIPLEKIIKITELTEKGHNRKDIAKELSCSPRTVWKYQKKYGYI